MNLKNKMKYLKPFNERIDHNLINDIAEEFNDLGFYDIINTFGDKQKVELRQTDGLFSNRTSVLSFRKSEGFYFDEIKDIVYRIKDVVGIENIGTFNYLYFGSNSGYTRCNKNRLENEELDMKSKLKAGFIIFNFPVI